MNKLISPQQAYVHSHRHDAKDDEDERRKRWIFESSAIHYPS